MCIQPIKTIYINSIIRWSKISYIYIYLFFTHGKTTSTVLIHATFVIYSYTKASPPFIFTITLNQSRRIWSNLLWVQSLGNMERRGGGSYNNNNNNHGEEERQQQWHDHDAEQDKLMVEEAFKNVPVPPWTKQITFRAMATSAVLSVIFNFIVCKLNLTTGVIPSLNVAAGLLGFALVKSWTTLLEKFGLLKQPFTRQENTVIQTCIVASSGIAFSSMFLSQLLLLFFRFKYIVWCVSNS